MVHQAARRCDDNLRIFAQAAELTLNILATVNRQSLNFRMLCHLVDFFGYLNR